MPYYYDLLNQHTGEIIYESDTPFNTIEDALVDAKKTLVSKEAFWRVFTTPPGRSEHEEPQVTSSISSEFESDVPELDWKMMIKIQSGIRDKADAEKRSLTPEEIDLVLLDVSGWDIDTDVGAELLAEAYEMVMNRGIHEHKETDKSYLDINVFSVDIMHSLSSKYGVKPPSISWQPILDTGWYYPPNWIIMSTSWHLAFKEDPAGTKMIIVRTLAHEFYHYIIDDPKLVTILPPGKEEQARVERLEAHEMDADEFALKETGVSVESEKEWWNRIVAPVLVRTGWVEETEKRIEERGYIFGPGDLL